MPKKTKLLILLFVIITICNSCIFSKGNPTSTHITTYNKYSSDISYKKIDNLNSDIDKYGRKKDVTWNNKGSQTTIDITDLGLPICPKGTKSQILYRKGYITSYNKKYKLPNWVTWHLTANHTDGDNKRSNNAWHEDTEVPEPRATIYDYRKSGWSRGHMCPAGDNKWDSDAMYDTFLLTNCCPQNARLNSGDWNEIEMTCRQWADKFGSIYIICGPILLKSKHETIGANRITVPEAFFKVILCLDDDPKGIGFICRNNDGNRKKDFYVNSIKQIERITGMVFFPNLKDEISVKVKDMDNLDQWN